MCNLSNIQRAEDTKLKENKNKPSFCPIRHGQPMIVCRREQSCKDCKADNIDSKVDPNAER
jgi:hypothetical protein